MSSSSAGWSTSVLVTPNLCCPSHSGHDGAHLSRTGGRGLWEARFHGLWSHGALAAGSWPGQRQAQAPVALLPAETRSVPSIPAHCCCQHYAGLINRPLPQPRHIVAPSMFACRKLQVEQARKVVEARVTKGRREPPKDLPFRWVLPRPAASAAPPGRQSNMRSAIRPAMACFLCSHDPSSPSVL